MSSRFNDKFKKEPIIPKNKKMKNKITRVSLKSGKNLKHETIKTIYNDILKKYDKNKISLFGMGIDGGRTIKTFFTDFKNWDDEEYYEDKDIDKNKFDSYLYFDIIIRK